MIEAGDYIRIKSGDIRKIIKINEGKEKTIFGKYGIDKPYNYSYSVAKSKIVKHSKNIIDLIEVGDIVELRDYIDNFRQTEKIGISDIQMLHDIIEGINEHKVKLISILRKEQYNANCYRLE